MLGEDEEQIRAVGQAALESAGYRVHLAHDGDDAMKQLEVIGQLDLSISDLKMPGSLSGERLIMTVHETRPNLPVLMTIGYSDTAPSEYPILVKPFRLHELLFSVKNLLREAALKQQIV